MRPRVATVVTLPACRAGSVRLLLLLSSRSWLLLHLLHPKDNDSVLIVVNLAVEEPGGLDSLFLVRILQKHKLLHKRQNI